MNNIYVTKQEFTNNNNLIADGLNRIFTILDSINNKIDEIENRLDGIDLRLDKIEFRLDKIEARLDKMDVRFAELEDKVSKNTNMLHEIMFDIKDMKEEQTVFAFRQTKNTDTIEIHSSKISMLENKIIG